MIIEHSKADSALSRSIEPERWQWFDLTNVLLAAAVNQKAFDMWRHSDEKRRGPFTPVVTPPGLDDEIESDTKSIPTDAMTVAEADAWLQSRRASGRL